MFAAAVTSSIGFYFCLKEEVNLPTPSLFIVYKHVLFVVIPIMSAQKRSLTIPEEKNVNNKG